MPGLQTASDLRDFSKLLRQEKKSRGEPAKATATTAAPIPGVAAHLNPEMLPTDLGKSENEQCTEPKAADVEMAVEAEHEQATVPDTPDAAITTDSQSREREIND